MQADYATYRSSCITWPTLLSEEVTQLKFSNISYSSGELSYARPYKISTHHGTSELGSCLVWAIQFPLNNTPCLPLTVQVSLRLTHALCSVIFSRNLLLLWRVCCSWGLNSHSLCFTDSFRLERTSWDHLAQLQSFVDDPEGLSFFSINNLFLPLHSYLDLSS